LRDDVTHRYRVARTIFELLPVRNSLSLAEVDEVVGCREGRYLSSDWGILTILSKSLGYQFWKKSQGFLWVVTIISAIVIIPTIVVVVPGIGSVVPGIGIVIVPGIGSVIPGIGIVIVPGIGGVVPGIGIVVVPAVFVPTISVPATTVSVVPEVPVVPPILTCYDATSDFATLDDSIITTLNSGRGQGREGDRVGERREKNQNSGEGVGELHGCILIDLVLLCVLEMSEPGVEQHRCSVLMNKKTGLK